MKFLTNSLLFFWQITKIIIISLAIIVPIRFFVVQPFFVRGASMRPSFRSGDYLIINEIGYRLGTPQRGDVVVFRPPQSKSQFYIKRIIGLPGETIKIGGGKVWFGKNDTQLQELNEGYLETVTYGDKNVSLAYNEYFVLGDNRRASSDSRNWGPLPRENIVGKAWLRPWPISNFSIIDSPVY